ncbi:MAG TPA: SLC13 family permease [Gammaproteobacteria bacterium]|nr:SLC13 family permease [Gammaproteobacteria bacterium]
MSPDAWIAVVVTLSCLLLLIFSRVPPDMALLAGLTVLLATGVVEAADAFAGFSNEAVLTVAALYVVAAGLRETGAQSYVVRTLFGRPRSVAGAQLRLMLPVTAVSGFLNNTPVVATFLPAVLDWAKQQRIAASKLLIPLSYAAIFGGVCTLIGTSTNLVVNGLIRSEAALPGFTFFELAWVGLPCALVGIGYVMLSGRWLLPDHPGSLDNLKDPREYTVEMLVTKGSALDGQTIEEAGLRHLPGLFLVEIDRNGEVIAAVEPGMRLHGGDRLIFTGVTESVVDLQRIRGLQPATDQVFKLDSLRAHRTLVEAVVSATSPIVGKTVRESDFRKVYGAVIIAVSRDGGRVRGKIGDIRIEPGDVLLLESDRQFVERNRYSRDFLLLRPIEGSPVPRHERAWVAGLILLGIVLAATLEVTSMLVAALVGAGAMLVTRCCTATVARRSIELDVLLVIAAAYGIGRALEVTGAAAFLAGKLLALAGNDPWILLAAIYFVTLLLTEVITNNAAAVLMFPLTLSTTQALDLNLMPFAVAITVAASAGFASPFGYQTHLMVYGPGGYRFRDFVRIGLPLDVLFGLTAVAIIPFVWPLR